MTPVRIEFNKKWIPYENKVEFYVDSKAIAFDGPLTTVHGFFFNDSKDLLLVKHKNRGWEIPGGHIEEGELPEPAMHRELFEEAQMKTTELHQLGYLKKVATGAKPKECHYPYPLSYCLFYGGHINETMPFSGDKSIVDFQFVSIAGAREYSWIQAYEEYLDCALSLF